MVKRNKNNSNKKLLIILGTIILILALVAVGLLIKNKFDLTGKVISGDASLFPQSCQNDWECPVGQNCNTGYCGTPIDCDPKVSINFNPKCPVQDVCNPETSKCQQGECQKNSDCASPFNVCENALCVQKECNIDNDCPITNDVYDKAKCISGICIKPMCDKDFGSCGLNGAGVCYSSLCLLKQCENTNQCPAGKVCNKGLCFQKECSNNDDCLADELCYDGICKEKACINDKSCPLGTLCDRAQCVVKPCTADTECKVGRNNAYCIYGSCSLAECKIHSDCGNGFACDGIKCILGEICDDKYDNDGNGYTDYADSKCAGYCVLPKKITKIVLGLGEGRPNLLKESETSVGCCNDNQCSSGSGCENNGGVIGIHIGQNSETSFCRVSGESAVWCRQGLGSTIYVNDGNGNCVLKSSGSEGGCVGDSDCPVIQCVRAPCPVNKCVSGECKITTTSAKQTCSIFKKCSARQKCVGSFFSGRCY